MHIFSIVHRGINPAGIYCLVQNNIQVVYDHMLNQVKIIILLWFLLRKFC